MKLIVLLMTFVLVACASDPIAVPDSAARCQDPRPQICTRDYRPACAFKEDGSQHVAGNPCEACADVEVVYFVPGEC